MPIRFFFLRGCSRFDVGVFLGIFLGIFQGMLANEQSKGMGEQEEGMDLADEVDMGGKVSMHFYNPFLVLLCAIGGGSIVIVHLV